MAVIKIFPEKDATIYSLFPNMNTGLDEIIEATLTTFAYSNPNPQTSRFLIKFAQEDVLSAINLIPQSTYDSGSWKANLQCFIATATGLALTSSIKCFPIAADAEWGMGTGRYLDDPISTNGTSWNWLDYSGSIPWTSSLGISGTTGSWTLGSYSVLPGGGVWYTGSEYSSSVTFTYRTDKDIDLNVTSIIDAWYPSASRSPIFPNYGFILKQDSEFVDSKDVQPELKYFSVDTNTIYPPALQFSWDDFTWNTGSSTQTILNTLPASVNITDNPGVFYSESINRFRINARPEFPTQIWTTSSVYLNNYYLPTASYYAIKDLETNEFIVDFDSTYTKLNADATSSYFDLYMNFLQPERYYKILIQSTIDGTTQVFDNQYYFKVING